jgi:hypothetical protein
MQNTRIIHIAGALLPADQHFELLRQRQPFGVASALSGFVHLRGKRVDGVTALSQSRLTDERRSYRENDRHDCASAFHAVIRCQLASTPSICGHANMKRAGCL